MNYYSASLNAERLLKVYESAPPRIVQFLEAEIRHVTEKVNASTSVLDLGCGYGRVAARLAEKGAEVTGIDISEDNIKMAREMWGNRSNMKFLVMDAGDLKFEDGSFDRVICVQNGISAFKLPPEKLLSEAARVTGKGGTVLFSSYSENIWDARLDWFKIQADLGLIGEINMEKTGEGRIICRDGFTASTYSAGEFLDLARRLELHAEVYEVDRSSVFCEITV